MKYNIYPFTYKHIYNHMLAFQVRELNYKLYVWSGSTKVMQLKKITMKVFKHTQ